MIDHVHQIYALRHQLNYLFIILISPKNQRGREVFLSISMTTITINGMLNPFLSVHLLYALVQAIPSVGTDQMQSPHAGVFIK